RSCVSFSKAVAPDSRTSTSLNCSDSSIAKVIPAAPPPMIAIVPKIFVISVNWRASMNITLPAKAWSQCLKSHGFTAPSGLQESFTDDELGSIEPSYPPGSTMLDDEAGGSARAGLQGHCPPKIEGRLPPPCAPDRMRLG